MPKNLDCEPAYPGFETVMLSLRNPDLTAHLKHQDCEIEEPHYIASCGIFTKPNNPQERASGSDPTQADTEGGDISLCECGHPQAKHGIGERLGKSGLCFQVDRSSGKMLCDCTGYKAKA